MLFLGFQTNFVRQKTPHPKELKAKAHKLFGSKKGEQLQQNEDGSGVSDNAHHEGQGDAVHENEKLNGVGPAVFFRGGVGTQQTQNGDYDDDGDIGDDENEEVGFH